MDKLARFVGIMLELQRMATSLLLAMSVLSQFAVLVMSTSEKMGLSLALSVRLGIEGTKVSLFVHSSFGLCSVMQSFCDVSTAGVLWIFQGVLEWMEMRMKMMLMI
jgi:hypothetical protein